MPTSPRVSTMPSASPTSALGATANSLSELRFIARTSSLRASTCRSFSGNKLPQLQILAHHHQRLRGVVEDAEQIAVLGARVDVFAIDVERHRPAPFNRVVEARLEARSENRQQPADASHRKTLAAQIREHHQLERSEEHTSELQSLAYLV